MLKNYLNVAALAIFLFSASPAYPEALPEGPMHKPQQLFSWSRAERFLGFKNVEKIAPTHTVEAGGKVRELAPAASPAGLKMAADLKKPSEKLIETGDVVGIMVIHGGEVLVEQYAHGFGPADRWTSFSVAKSISGTLAGAAVNEGLLGLDEQVVKYVPELIGSAYDGVTVRHLLTMTSGVAWNESYTDASSDTSSLARGFASADPLADLAKLPRQAEPGQSFSYKTGESNLLGIVIMRAVKKPLAQYLSEKIWRPCGMEKSAAWAIDSEGREMAGCCLSISLGDYARFGLFILDELKSKNGRVLPASWLREATRPVLGHNYGYQWHLIDKEIFAASGIFGQMIAIDGPNDSVAVILSAWDSPLSEVGNNNRLAYLSQLRKVILKNEGGYKKK